MTRPKHERLVEVLTDAFWSAENGQRALTDPGRMSAVVNTIVDLLQSQTRAEDAQGALFWAGKWLQQRLQEDADG